jgi:polysaccharide export outer membrane protein
MSARAAWRRSLAVSLLLGGCASSGGGGAEPARVPVQTAPSPAVEAPPSGPASGASGPVERERYVIGSDDVLSISVWKEEGLSRQVRVRPDGRVSFPLVGDVDAAGRTAPQLEAELSRQLAAFVTAPAVSVVVDEVNSYKVYVMGEVAKPGPLPARSPVTVLEALALAGGLKPFADGNRMMLVRQDRNGQTVRMRLSYKDLVLGRNGAVNHTLESGDVLVVP